MTKSKLAVASLVLGIISILFFFIGGWILGIIAIVLGFIARSDIKKDPSLEGNRLAIAGIVMGILSILLALALLVFGIAFIRGQFQAMSGNFPTPSQQ
jgi:hypothetical protein